MKILQKALSQSKKYTLYKQFNVPIAKVSADFFFSVEHFFSVNISGSFHVFSKSMHLNVREENSTQYQKSADCHVALKAEKVSSCKINCEWFQKTVHDIKRKCFIYKEREIFL